VLHDWNYQSQKDLMGLLNPAEHIVEKIYGQKYRQCLTSVHVMPQRLAKGYRQIPVMEELKLKCLKKQIFEATKN